MTRRPTSARLLTPVAVSAALLAGCATAGGAEPGELNPCGPTTSISGATPPESIDDAWTAVFVDDFNRCDLGDDYGTYSGSPGGNPVGHWDSSMVAVHDGVLRLSGQKIDGEWVTGGVSNHPVTRRYGRWEVRMRADPSADLSYHMLLWPQDEQWPPEIDFAESVASDRRAMSAFLHWRDAQDGNRKRTASTLGTFDDWHTVGVEWMPGTIRYLIDGEVWAEIDETSGASIPDNAMWLGMQVEAGACERRVDWGMNPCGDDEARPDSADVDIDWVAVYEPTGTSPDTPSRTGGAVELVDP